MTWRRRIRVAAAVGALAVAAAACGDDGNGTTNAGGPGTTALAGPTLEISAFANPDDLDLSPSDRMGRSATSVVYLDGDDVIHVVEADGSVQAVDLTDAIVGDGEEIASMLFPVTTCGDVVVAVDGLTGELRWTGSAPDLEDEDGDGVSPLACTAGTVVAQGETTVIGLDAADGSIRWEAALEPDDPPFSAGDLVAIGTCDGIVGLDATTGEERFRVGEGSDQVGTISSVGFTVLLASGLQVVSTDGDVLGEVGEDILDELTGGAVAAEELEVAGSPERPVLVVPATNVGVEGDPGAIVNLDGSTVDLPTGERGIVEVLGPSGELVWVRIVTQSEGTSTMSLALVDAAGTVVAETAVDRRSTWPTAITDGFAVVGDQAGQSG